MALVAADAGDDVLRAALKNLLAVVRVVDPGAGHIDEVGLPLGHRAVGPVRVLESGGGAHHHVQSQLVDCPAYLAHLLQIGGGHGLGGGEAQGVLGVHLTGAQVNNVDQAFSQFAELDGVLHGVASLRLGYRVDHLQGDAGTYRLADGLEDFQQEAAAVFHTAAVLVSAVVGQRGEEPGMGRVTVTAVHGDDVKT